MNAKSASSEKSSGRLVIVQYCDDVRLEIAGKISLIGCYAEELIVQSFPIVLPKLCAQVRAIAPKDEPFLRLKVIAKLNGEAIAELENDLALLAEAAAHCKAAEDAQRYAMNIFLVFAPLVLNEPGTLRVIAETEDGELLGTKLTIRAQNESEVMPATPFKR